MQQRIGSRNVVLLGVGHTHAHIVKQWAMGPLEDVNLICITNFLQATYSGMLPGVLAGDYRADQMQIDLIQLMSAAQAHWIQETVTRVDLHRREIHFATGRVIPYDLLSVAVGSAPPDVPMLEVAREEVVNELTPGSDTSLAPVDQTATDPISSSPSVRPLPIVLIKPMQTWLERLQQGLVQARANCLSSGRSKIQIDVVGGGLGSVEIVLCIPNFLAEQGFTADQYLLRLISGSQAPPEGCLASTKAKIAKILTGRNVQLQLGQRLQAVAGSDLVLASGQRLHSDLVIYIGAGNASQVTGLIDVQRDQRGCIVTNDCLESVDDHHIWAGGDCGSIQGLNVPKAGVYAVRQGPVMWNNLVRWKAGQPLKPYVPQDDFLKLVNLGGKQAIGQWKGVSFQGRWVWQLKDWIDTKFIHMYQHLPQKVAQMMATGKKRGVDVSSAAASTDRPEMRCLGCGGKISASSLRTVLRELAEHYDQGSPVYIGHDLNHPPFSPLSNDAGSDDVALFQLQRSGNPSDTQGSQTPVHSLAMTVDAFASPLSDPWLSGRLAVLHALSDLWASGVSPEAVLSSIEIPFGSDRAQQRILKQVMRGICDELAKHRVKLLGGHTMEGPRLAIALTATGRVFGEVLPGPKQGLQAGDCLLVTKPLGTGIALAALMRALCSAQTYQATIAGMLVSNQASLSLLAELSIHAITDITGFGLLGHLHEMVGDQPLQMKLDMDAIVDLTLPGIPSLLNQGVRSTMFPHNQGFLLGTTLDAKLVKGKQSQQQLALDLILDPQTCGGLLFAIPAKDLSHCQRMLQQLGLDQNRVIGSVQTRSTSDLAWASWSI